MDHRDTLRENVVYRAAELFSLQPELSTAAIAQMLNEQFRLEPRLTRETTYELLIQARAQQHVRLIPPRESVLEEAIATTFSIARDRVQVVNVMSHRSNAFVAAAAADLVYDLITEQALAGKKELGLGLGPGRATRDFARHLGIRLGNTELPITLRLTAIAAGCPALEPEYAPASFFALFPPGSTSHHVGFFARSVMKKSEINAAFRKKAGIREAFQEKESGRIQIIVTSMGDFTDRHDLMRQFLQSARIDPATELPEWVGSVQYRPYSVDGPIQEPPHVPRAATLYELAEFEEQMRQGKLKVVLISRCCGSCGSTHEKALLPLLVNPALRVWTHIVLDVPTAFKVLESRSAGPRSVDRARIEKTGRVFLAADLFSSTDTHSATTIADRINADTRGPSRVTREMVYTLLQSARRDKMLQMVPRLEASLAGEVAAAFGLDPETIRVVDTPTHAANALVADRAAAWALELAEDLMARFRPKWDAEEAREKDEEALRALKKLHGVGIGVGPGRASLDFCRSLGERLRRGGHDLKLRLIAMAAGSPATMAAGSPGMSPDYSSINFFNLIPSESIAQQVGYFAETLMTQKEFASAAFRKTTGVMEPFDEKEKQRIHIIVNSMGDLSDRHDLLANLLRASDVDPDKQLKGCVGSVQYRPYTETGPFKEAPDTPRAATLFELEEFAELAAMKNRHVILIVRRCGFCDRRYADAVKPLLRNKALRVWSELVIDAATARSILDDK